MFNVKREVVLSKIQLSLRGQVSTAGKFDWTSAVLDAPIISGITLHKNRINAFVGWRARRELNPRPTD